MKIWSITFTGIYPVGSAAISTTRDSETESEACDHFRLEWRSKYPNCDPEPVTATLLSVEPGTVHILTNGDY